MSAAVERPPRSMSLRSQSTHDGAAPDDVTRQSRSKSMGNIVSGAAIHPISSQQQQQGGGSPGRRRGSPEDATVPPRQPQSRRTPSEERTHATPEGAVAGRRASQHTPEGRKQSASPALGLERARSFGGGGGVRSPDNDTPTTQSQAFGLKRAMTRINMGASALPPEQMDAVSVRSGGGVMFAHQLGPKITRSVIKPKAVVGEEDRVCHDLVKACTLMEGRWSVTAHATINGAAQSLLQTPLEILRKPDAWQSWWASLNDNGKTLEDLARRLYLENSSDRMSDFDNDPMHPVGTSRLHERTHTLLHVWQSAECAKLFVKAWFRAWQAIMEHRIEGIFAPLTVLYCIEGKYISATALPPLLKDSPPTVVPGKEPAGASLLGSAAEQLMLALQLPPEVTGLVLAPGFDGRHYIVSVKEINSRRLPPPFDSGAIRTEALFRCMKDNALSQADKYVLRTLVPAAVEDLAKLLLKKRLEERTIAELTKDGVLRIVLHANGVNLALLHHVSLCAQHRFLETQEAAYRTVIDLAYTEMVGRVLKQFVRVDVLYHASEGRDTEADRLDVINRFAMLFVSKDVPFWLDYVLPAVRHKYHAPDTFELSHDQVHIPTVLRIASSRIGCEYVQESQRFDKFAMLSGMWLITCRTPDWLATDTPRTSEQVKETVMSMWRETDVIDEPKMKRVFRARAFVASIMLNTGTSVAKEEFDRVTSYAETQGATIEARIDDIRITSLMLDLRMEPPDKRKLVERYVRKVSKFPSSNFSLDGALITVKYLQAVACLKNIGDVPPVELIEAALRQFDSIPGMNFPFSVVHAQALVTAEQAIPGIAEASVPVYHSIVAEAKRVIGSLHGPLQLAKYLHRAMWAMVDAPFAEAHEGSALLCGEAFKAHVAAYEIDDNRSAQMAFLTGLFLARHASRRLQEGSVIRDSLRKIVESMRAVAAANQIAIGRAGISMTILQRAEILARKCPTAEQLAPACGAVLDYLKRFGTPLFASLFIQRVGRGFDDRRWMDWLRRDANARVLQRVGRGLLHRRFRMFALYKKKIVKLRTVLNRFVQRVGRAYLLRIDMYQLHLLRNVMRGALTRVRLNHRRWHIRKVQAVGRGYLGRLLVAAPYQEEVARRLEMERQRRLQAERERLSAAAERCRQRMLEVQRKLLEAAWDRVRVCMTDETRFRDILTADSLKEFQAIARAAQKNLMHVEELEARRKDKHALEAKAREEEDRAEALQRKLPNLIQRRCDMYREQTPLTRTVSNAAATDAGASGSRARAAESPNASPARSRASPWESNSGAVSSPHSTRVAATTLDINSPHFPFLFEEQHQRRLIRRQYLDELEILLMWGMFCRIQLSRAAQRKKTSLLAELERRSYGAAYNDESAAAERQLVREKAAIRIQCAWRSNTARFELRYRTLARDILRRHVYAKYYDGVGPLSLAPSRYERERNPEQHER